EGIFEGLQSFLLQVYITEIIIHKADEPDAVVNFFDADGLASQAAAEISNVNIGTGLVATPNIWSVSASDGGAATLTAPYGAWVGQCRARRSGSS
ncbi:MAG TPA: hypothetical protein VE133_06945, partial [Candidatus Sulfotelmatobacter sp.]|nr:hypothetical protein [Candidatus Sulfotelmatobacter sp.]